MLQKAFLPTSLIIFSILSFNSVALSSTPKMSARISSLKNSVQIKYRNHFWKNAWVNENIKPGATIRTGNNSKVQLIYNDGTINNIGSRTSLALLNKPAREIKISYGDFWYKVTKKSYGLKIYFPNAIAAITGTEGGVKVERIKNKWSKSNVTVGVAEGTISVFMNNKKFLMKAGDRVLYSTITPANIDFKHTEIEKVKDLFETSK